MKCIQVSHSNFSRKKSNHTKSILLTTIDTIAVILLHNKILVNIYFYFYFICFRYIKKILDNFFIINFDKITK